MAGSEGPRVEIHATCFPCRYAEQERSDLYCSHPQAVGESGADGEAGGKYNWDSQLAHTPVVSVAAGGSSEGAQASLAGGGTDWFSGVNFSPVPFQTIAVRVSFPAHGNGESLTSLPALVGTA
jgi:hypothetical protein